MSALRFKAGEIAIFNGNVSNPKWFMLRAGMEVEIVAVGPFPVGTMTTGPIYDGRPAPSGHETDYECRTAEGVHFHCTERWLRKRPQPGIPESVRSWFEVKQGESV